MLAELRIHHLGVLVKDLEVAAGNYVRNFGYQIRSDVIHDPAQTAFVRFLVLPGDACYLELICPDGEKSMLTNALKKGGGINHVCYATSNISESVKALHASGCWILHEPQPAVAFPGRSIAWLMGTDGLLVELVEQGPAAEL
jgi:methylmalonyl-CoA/ethylmalonyl-CoA epimerase